MRFLGVLFSLIIIFAGAIAFLSLKLIGIVAGGFLILIGINIISVIYLLQALEAINERARRYMYEQGKKVNG